MEVIAYKGMESNMTCRGFQYEIGKTYKTDSVELCKFGFHACLNPIDALDYYFQEEHSRYFRVKLCGETTKCGNFDTNVAATEITILEEINIDEVIETTEWWKNDNVLDLLHYSEGFARVQRGDGLMNFIDKNGNYLYNDWFHWLSNFNEGFARVQRGNDELWNFIDKQGNFLTKKWFNLLGKFHDGFAVIQRGDNLYNFIDKNSNYLSDEWFYYVYSFYNGFARVQRGYYLYNFIDKNGNYLSDEWFKYSGDFSESFAKVQRTNGEWCKIDKIGKLHKD